MTQPYERQCTNWLADFMKWTLPRSEAKESFIFWTGLFTLSAALRRHVKIPRKYLGSWEAAPNLYVLFVGPPGSRKTTTADYSLDLIDEVPGITPAPDQVSMPKLLTQLVESPDSSMYINAGEFGEFMVKSGVEMYSFLTNAYDGRRKISVGTHLRGVELAERPVVNLLGATTPAWVADNMPESVLGGGFASRVIFIFEESVRRRKMFHTDINVEELHTQHKDKLIQDLIHIGTNLWGDFEIAPDAEEWMENWYQKNAEGVKHHTKLYGYYERKPAHILKVAQLLHVAYSDELIIQKRDLEDALKLLEGTEPGLLRVFSVVGRNEYKLEMRDIYLFIAGKGKCKLEDIKQKFLNSAQPQIVDQLIQGLVSAGLVGTVSEGLQLYYTIKKQVEL